MNKVALLCFGLGLTNKKEYSTKDKLLGFLTLVPPIFWFLTPINAASAVVLSIGGYPAWDKAIVGLVTVALAGWGVNAFNHYVDRERDKVIWPERALPAGRVKPHTAIISTILAFICTFLLSLFFFNFTNCLLLLLAIVLGTLYSAFLRDRVGYLSLPPIVGLVSLGGWAAFSPETLFTSGLPWFLYALHFCWQAAHIMIYYPLHINNDAIDRHDIKNPPAFFLVPSSRTAVAIGMGFACLTLFLSILLPLFFQLSYLYLIVVIASGVYGLTMGWRFLKDAANTKKGLQAFTALSIFRLVTVVAILLDVFLSHL